MGYASVTLPVERWPEGDRARWELANRSGDILDEDGPAAGWSPVTRVQVAKDWGRFLFWLEQNGGIDLADTPSERLEAGRLDGYLAHLQSTGMASTSLESRFRSLCQAVAIMDTTSDRQKLKDLCRRLKARAVPRREKHARLVDSADLSERSLRQYDALIGGQGTIGIERCCHARDALMLAFLAYHPLRLRTFAALDLGGGITRNDARYHLDLDRSAVKEKRVYSCDVDDDLTPYLDHYLHYIRPRLLRGLVSDRLWVARYGSAISDSAVYYQIVKMTSWLLGHQINPHLVRDCVMTYLVLDDPANARIGSRILGHRSLRTAERHYDHAGAAMAQRAHAAMVRRLRARFLKDDPPDH